METSQVSFQAAATGSDLGLIVRFNSQVIYHSDDLPQAAQEICYEFEDNSETSYVLEIELTGKLPEHTQINADGDIIQDRVIKITDMVIDDIKLEYLVTEVTEYHHDENGTRDSVVLDKFYGDMGCNGVARFKFHSPVYLWLLENL